MSAKITTRPCSHCGSTTHERTSFGGLTLIYCTDDAACQERIERKIKDESDKKERVTDDK